MRAGEVFKQLARGMHPETGELLPLTPVVDLKKMSLIMADEAATYD